MLLNIYTYIYGKKLGKKTKKHVTPCLGKSFRLCLSLIAISNYEHSCLSKIPSRQYMYINVCIYVGAVVNSTSNADI